MWITFFLFDVLFIFPWDANKSLKEIILAVNMNLDKSQV